MLEVHTIHEKNLNTFNLELTSYRNKGYTPIGGVSTCTYSGVMYFTISLEKFTQAFSSPE
jgi:hypothetical protein